MDRSPHIDGCHRRPRLDGLTVVVDCANGAASEAAPRPTPRRARVIAINHHPDGLNINDRCGSTHLEPLREAVRTHGADLGPAHDWRRGPLLPRRGRSTDRWSTATAS